MRSLITLQEGADKLRCHKATIKRRIARGELDYVQFTPRGRKFVIDEQIDELIEKNRKGATNGET